MLFSGIDARSQPTDPAASVIVVASRTPNVRARLVELALSHDPSATVEEATSGDEVLAAFRRQAPTIAFVDVYLDGLSGAEAVARAKSEGLQAYELILMSSRVHEGWVEVCHELDAYEFLRTPLDPLHIARLLRETALRFRQIQNVLVISSRQGRQFVWRALSESRFTFQIEEADSSAHARKQMQLVPFDMAFIDFDLADRDGLEAACQIHAVSPETRLVLMASGDAEGLVQAARHCGISLILKKPFSALDIDVALHEVLEMRRPYLLNALMAKSAVLHIPPLKPAKAHRPVAEAVAARA